VQLRRRADVAPLRLAEDYAMVDILTGERVIFRVRRDYHMRSARRLEDRERRSD